MPRWPPRHRTENTRLLCELMLEIVEAFEVEPSSLSELTSRLRQYVADGGHHLAIRLAVQESRLFRALGQSDEERAAIDRVLPLLSRVGNEAAAVELYGRRAALQDVVGGAPAEALRDLENEIAITRRTLGFSRERESALAHLRVRAGRIAGVPAFAEFVDAWRTHIGEAEQLVAMVAASAQLSSRTDLDEAFAELVGVEGRFPYLLFQTAALCNQWREAGQPDVALAVATASVPMAAVLGDCQIAGILHNECGLDQMKLKQPDAAFQHFTAAMAEAEAAGDLAGLYDDIFNASEAAQASKQFDRLSSCSTAHNRLLKRGRICGDRWRCPCPAAMPAGNWAGIARLRNTSNARSGTRAR
jgi:hypothetical protein